MFEDLKPYVCTFPDCTMSEHLFENRKEWYKHETQYHRLDWSCNTDGHPDFQSQSRFIRHMSASHGAHLDEKKLVILRAIFQRPSKRRSGDCNLCGVSAERLETHVANHLQQISLFALPRVNTTQGSGDPDFDTQSSRLRGEEQAKSQELSWQSRSVSPRSVNEEKSVTNMGETQVPSEETLKVPLHMAQERRYEILGLLSDDEVANIDESLLLPVLEAVNATELFLLLDSTEDFNFMALQTASKAGFVGVAQFLLERGRVNVNATTDLGFTPLMMAAEAGHLSMLQMLISKGADVNMRNTSNTTALMMAKRAGHESAVQLLLEHNAEIDSSDDINNAKLKSASKAKQITRLSPLKVKIYPTKN